MPPQSEGQQKTFGIALAMKRGETPYSYSPEAAAIAKSMSEEKIREFAKYPNPNAILDILNFFSKGWWF